MSFSRSITLNQTNLQKNSIYTQLSISLANFISILNMENDLLFWGGFFKNKTWMIFCSIKKNMTTNHFICRRNRFTNGKCSMVAYLLMVCKSLIGLTLYFFLSMNHYDNHRTCNNPILHDYFFFITNPCEIKKEKDFI